MSRKITKAHKTYSQKPSEIQREWLLIDAEGAVLGRLATVISNYLTGKRKPTYTAHVDNGDYVIVTNAKLIKVTGDKETAKNYFKYSGYPGGMKKTNLAAMRQKSPEKIIELAVKGMLPKNKLQDERMKRLKVFSDANHSHEAQTPKKVEIK